ncbi:MAG: RDD family protein [Pseudomonadota bacterium]
MKDIKTASFVRLLAFLIDYSIFVILFFVFNACLYFKIPDLLIAFIELILFCFYFFLLDHVYKPGIGKRIFKLKIFSFQNEELALKSQLFRILIFGCIFIFKWGSLGSILSILPFSIILFINILPISLIIYSIFLHFLNKNGLMLHDVLSKSWIVPRDTDFSTVNKIEFKKLSKQSYIPLLIMIIIFAFLVNFTLARVIPGMLMGDLASLSTQQSTGETEGQSPEEFISQKLNFRHKLEMDFQVTETKSAFGESQTSKQLIIKLWVPAIVWFTKDRDEIRNTILKDLKFQQGYVDSGTIVIWTGIEYYSIKESHSLIFNELKK